MAPPPPPDLIDDAIVEILLRLPPDEPEHLFRAALVCKPWLRILCDPAFLRRYRAYHGDPPLLGLLHRLLLDGDSAPRFASTTSMPDFPHPGSDGRRTRPLDCRHGRVLVQMLDDDESAGYLVWNPVSGDWRAVPELDFDRATYTAAVFCTADGCDHLDCHDGPFHVAFVGSDATWHFLWASVYSSETGVWSTPVSLDNGRGFHIWPRRATLVGNEIIEMYFTMTQHTAIIGKYIWVKNCLSVVEPPPQATNSRWVSLMTMVDGSLGLAGAYDSSLYLWLRKVNSEGAAEWVVCRIIELKTKIPMENPSDRASVVGSAEGVGVIFVRTGVGLFIVELKSERVRKVDEPGAYFSVFPYMNFYTPDRGSLLSLARAL